MFFKSYLIPHTGFSLLETLFALLISGLFVSAYFSSYASALKLKSDVKIRSEVNGEISSKVNNLMNSAQLHITTSDTREKAVASLASGVFFDFSTRGEYSPSVRDHFISMDECKSLGSKGVVVDGQFEFPSCIQLFLKKIEGATDLYCYSVLAISEFSDAKELRIEQSGILHKELSVVAGENALIHGSENADKNACNEY